MERRTGKECMNWGKRQKKNDCDEKENIGSTNMVSRLMLFQDETRKEAGASWR
jgi:hypothetical protein